jgi:type IV secretory pathway TrbL component
MDSLVCTVLVSGLVSCLLLVNVVYIYLSGFVQQVGIAFERLTAIHTIQDSLQAIGAVADMLENP